MTCCTRSSLSVFAKETFPRFRQDQTSSVNLIPPTAFRGQIKKRKTAVSNIQNCSAASREDGSVIIEIVTGWKSSSNTSDSSLCYLSSDRRSFGPLRIYISRRMRWCNEERERERHTHFFWHRFAIISSPFSALLSASISRFAVTPEWFG